MDVYTIILADDHAMLREGIRKIIERIEDVQISGEVNDGIELLELLKNVQPQPRHPGHFDAQSPGFGSNKGN